MELQSLIVLVLFFSILGAALGLWLLMLTDLSRRAIDTSARLAWLALLLFVPGLGLVVYYLTVVKPGIGVPEHFSDRRGKVLSSKRGQLILVLSGVAVAVFVALLVVPVSIEVVNNVPPSRVPNDMSPVN